MVGGINFDWCYGCLENNLTNEKQLDNDKLQWILNNTNSDGVYIFKHDKTDLFTHGFRNI